MPTDPARPLPPVERAPAPSSDRALLVGLFTLLCAVACLPMLLVRYPPLPDLSEHLAAVAVIHNLGDPRFDLDRYYERSLALNPYWGYYGPVHLLAYLFGVERAGRVFLALTVCALPVGTALLARRFGRSPWVALLAFPLAWNFNFAIGFISFCAGLSLLPFALAAFDAFCARPSTNRALLAGALGLCTYFAHLLSWGAWLACAGLIGLLHEAPPGRRLVALRTRAALWSVPFLVGAGITLLGKGLHIGAGQLAAKGIAWKHYPVTQSLGEFGRWVFQPLPGNVDDALALSLLGAFLLLKLSSPRQAITLHRLRAEACFAAMMIAYLVLPRSLLAPAYWWGVNVRFACIAALFLALTVQGDIDLRRGWRRFLLVPAFAVALFWPIQTTLDWQRANAWAAGYDDLRELPEPGSRVLFVLGEPWHDEQSVFNYVHTYYGFYQAQRGGYMPWNFDDGFPLRYKVRYPSGGWREQRFAWEEMAPFYDYVLAFNRTAPSLFGRHVAEAREVKRAGRWTLYRLPGPRRDDSPWPTYPNPWP